MSTFRERKNVMIWKIIRYTECKRVLHIDGTSACSCLTLERMGDKLSGNSWIIGPGVWGSYQKKTDVVVYHVTIVASEHEYLIGT